MTGVQTCALPIYLRQTTTYSTSVMPPTIHTILHTPTFPPTLLSTWSPPPPTHTACIPLSTYRARWVTQSTCTHSSKIIPPRTCRPPVPLPSHSMGTCHLYLVFSHHLPLLGHLVPPISQTTLATTLCRTLPHHLPILGIHPPSLTQTLATNRPTFNHPFIRRTNQIKIVSGGTRGSMRVRRTCISSLTTCHTNLNSNSCPPSLISNSSHNRVLLRMSSCNPLTLPTRKLGLRRVGLNRILPPQLPHSLLPQNQARRSNRHRHVRVRSVSRIILTHLPNGRNG